MKLFKPITLKNPHHMSISQETKETIEKDELFTREEMEDSINLFQLISMGSTIAIFKCNLIDDITNLF